MGSEVAFRHWDLLTPFSIDCTDQAVCWREASSGPIDRRVRYMQAAARETNGWGVGGGDAEGEVPQLVLSSHAQTLSLHGDTAFHFRSSGRCSRW